MGPKSIWLSSWWKGELVHKDTQGEHCVKMKAEIGVLLLPAKEHQRLPTDCQKPGERHGIISSSQPTERHNPADTLMLGIGVSKTVRQHIFVVSATEFMALCFWNSRKLIWFPSFNERRLDLCGWDGMTLGVFSSFCLGHYLMTELLLNCCGF